MNWNYLLLILPFLMLIAQFYAIYDWITKRKFPTFGLKALFLILIGIPPIIGVIIYYYLLIGKGKYAKVPE